MRVKTKNFTRYCCLGPHGPRQDLLFRASVHFWALCRKVSFVHGTKVCACLRLAELKLAKQAEERSPRLGEGQQLLWLAYPGSNCLSSGDVAAVVGGAAAGCSAMQGAAEDTIPSGLHLAQSSAHGLPCCQRRTALSALPY